MYGCLLSVFYLKIKNMSKEHDLNFKNDVLKYYKHFKMISLYQGHETFIEHLTNAIVRMFALHNVKESCGIVSY